MSKALSLSFELKEAHPIPHADSFYSSVVNELQIFHPEAIQFTSSASSADFHMFTSVSPTVINNDEVVTVSYATNAPSTHDWIAAYSPASSFVNNITALAYTVPVKYGWCDETTDYNVTGVGSLNFNLTNLRNDVVFVYYTGSTYYPQYLNMSTQTVAFNNTNEPLRPRVVATGDTDPSAPNRAAFSLVWSSATSATPTLRFGTSPGVYTSTVAAETGSIDKTDLCGAPATTVGWFDMGLFHTANFTGVLPTTAASTSSVIYYSFGDASTSDYSKEYVFNIPPAAGSQPPAAKGRGTRVILYDDMGRGGTDDTVTWNHYGDPSIYTAMTVAAEVQAGTVDAIYHGGDISYATGYLAVWDFFLDMISPLASGAVYLTTVGNHETDWPDTACIYPDSTDSGGECGVVTTTLLPMPQPAATNTPWWSYDVGLIHMVGMSTEHDFSIGSPQYLWLEADLASVNRTATPWVIFGGHRAMYINSDYVTGDTSDGEVMAQLIENVEPLLMQYKVNFAFWGHNHVVQRQAAVFNSIVVQLSEERTDPVTGDTVHVHENPQAPVHMVIGSGGARFTVNYVTPYPDWNERTFYEWGYTRAEAVNASYMTLDWVQCSDGVVQDRMVITQQYTSDPWPVPSSSSSSSSGSDSSMSPGVIAGVVLCLLVLVAGVVLGLVYRNTTWLDPCCRRTVADASSEAVSEGKAGAAESADKAAAGARGKKGDESKDTLIKGDSSSSSSSGRVSGPAFELVSKITGTSGGKHSKAKATDDEDWSAV